MTRDDRIRELTTALREARTPRTDPAAVWAGLQARRLAGDRGPDIEVPAARTRRVGWFGAATVVLAGAVLAMAWPRTTEPAQPVAAAVAVPPDPAPLAPTRAEPPRPAPTLAQREAAAAPAPPAIVPAPSQPRQRARPRKPVAADTPVPTVDPDAELRLIRRAWTALDGGDPQQALRVLDEHAQGFPGGLLATEREATRVIALCGAGTDADARAAAERFLAAHPRSTYAARIRSTCTIAITKPDGSGHP